MGTFWLDRVGNVVAGDRPACKILRRDAVSWQP
jgi:hypothetical protein